jgi:hypothetical protein
LTTSLAMRLTSTWSHSHPRWERVSESSRVPVVQHCCWPRCGAMPLFASFTGCNQPMLVARRFHRRGISAARSQWRFSDRGVRSYHGRPACPDCCKALVSERAGRQPRHYRVGRDAYERGTTVQAFDRYE